MNIMGIGTDIVSISRIRAIWDRFGLAFARRILMPIELEEFNLSNKPVAFLAKRFAAKEAFAKACGSGFRAGGIWLTDIGLTHNAMGKPEMAFSTQAQKMLQALGAGQSHITLSDEQDYALAFVILMRAT
jgi:holo-[acyl-carrier protein] synthase